MFYVSEFSTAVYLFVLLFNVIVAITSSNNPHITCWKSQICLRYTLQAMADSHLLFFSLGET